MQALKLASGIRAVPRLSFSPKTHRITRTARLAAFTTAMASETQVQLDKSTPETKWKEILSTEEVSVSFSLSYRSLETRSRHVNEQKLVATLRFLVSNLCSIRNGYAVGECFAVLGIAMQYHHDCCMNIASARAPIMRVVVLLSCSTGY